MDQVRSLQTGAEDISPDCEPLIVVDEVEPRSRPPVLEWGRVWRDHRAAVLTMLRS